MWFRWRHRWRQFSDEWRFRFSNRGSLDGYPYLDTPRIPADLAKAFGDPFDYMVILRNGMIFYFTEAALAGEWVTLTGIRAFSGIPLPKGDPLSDSLPNFERGIQVRLADIIAVADAPWGS